MQETGGDNRLMSERSDKAWNTRISESYFETLYQKYANDVLRVSYFYLGDHQQAEDVTQEVFMRLLTKTPYLEEGKEKSWLLKVALNRCRDLWRNAWVKRVVLGSKQLDIAQVDDQMDEKFERQELLKNINQLPPVFKEVILLHYYQGYGIQEIANLLSVPEGTISSRLSRARKKLEDMIKGSENHEH